MNNIITIKIEQDIVMGAITAVSGHGIAVEIHKPYSGLVGYGAHIPCFARSVHDYRTDYGRQEAENILTSLFMIARTIETETENIQRKLNKYFMLKREIFHRMQSMEDSLACLRQQVKKHEISNKEYQSKRKIILQVRDEYDDESKNLFKDLFVFVVNDKVVLDEEKAVEYMQRIFA